MAAREKTAPENNTLPSILLWNAQGLINKDRENKIAKTREDIQEKQSQPQTRKATDRIKELKLRLLELNAERQKEQKSMDQRKHYVERHKPDLIFINETWIPSKLGNQLLEETGPLNIPEYSFLLFGRDSNNGRGKLGGGLAIYWKTETVTVTNSHVQQETNTTPEVIVLAVECNGIPGEKCTCVLVYHSSTAKAEHTINYAKRLVTKGFETQYMQKKESKGEGQPRNFIICGDFNRIPIVEPMTSLGFKQLVTFTTSKHWNESRNPPEPLDMIFTNIEGYNSFMCSVEHPLTLLRSDHLPVVVNPKRMFTEDHREFLAIAEEVNQTVGQEINNFREPNPDVWMKMARATERLDRALLDLKLD